MTRKFGRAIFFIAAFKIVHVSLILPLASESSLEFCSFSVVLRIEISSLWKCCIWMYLIQLRAFENGAVFYTIGFSYDKHFKPLVIQGLSRRAT